MARVIRRGNLGLVPAALQAVPGQVGAAATILNEATSVINQVESVFSGSSHKYAAPNYEGAEKARADAAALGVAAGSVLAGQYLLGQHRTNTSDYSQSYTGPMIDALEAKYGPVMTQANLAGPVSDSADGYGVLGILKQFNIPFSEQYAGFSTDTGQGPAGATADLVQYLKTLPVSTGTTSTTGTALSVAGITGGGPGTFLVVLGALGAVGYAVAKSRPRAPRVGV